LNSGFALNYREGGLIFHQRELFYSEPTQLEKRERFSYFLDLLLQPILKTLKAEKCLKPTCEAMFYRSITVSVRLFNTQRSHLGTVTYHFRG
ncbi:hypothetical protein AVEN_136600-1, partial [Araneus ventricosus]